MTWVAVAKKDFSDAVQSRSLWALSAFFILLSLGLTYGYSEFEFLSAGTETTIGGLVFFLGGIVGLFVSITSIVICYRAIAGERELGSAKILLSLPHSRLDVLVGKVVGRTAVLAVPLIIALGLGLSIGIIVIGAGSILSAVIFLGWTFFFALVYVSIIVGLSALVSSTTKAAALGIGFFFIVEFLWDGVAFVLLFVANGFSLPTAAPDWYFVVTQVPPSNAYFSGLVALLPDVAAAVNASTGAAGFDAFYAVPEIGIVILCLWLIVPISIGYTVFSRADL